MSAQNETSNVWINIRVSPGYAARHCAVVWEVKEDFEGFPVFVYRSDTGGPPWVLLNKDDPAVMGFFVDNEFNNDSKHIIPHYRLLLVCGEEKYPSPTIGLFETVKRHEYGIARAIIAMEFKRMSTGNGLKCFLFPLKRQGTPAAGVDPLTNQKLEAGCNESEGTGYGELLSGGYGEPVITWVELYGEKQLVSADDSTKGASVEKAITEARFLPFPRPLRGYMAVFPDTDNRYVVGEIVQAFMFKGAVPVAYRVQLSLLERSNPRYGVPLPSDQ
jgi:hypothetical protein